MANTRLKELSYRRFDELLNEVYIDLPSFTREGMVEPAQLIKIAQMCNYELGLKINKTKETILDIEHGRAKLPSDFNILNFAILCSHHRVIEPGLFNGLHTEDVAVPILNPSLLPQLTNCPCWNILNDQQENIVTSYIDCNSNSHEIVIPAGANINICGISISNPNNLLIVNTDKFCYSDPNTGFFTCLAPAATCCTPTVTDQPCNSVNANPFYQNRVYTTCNETMQVNVIEHHSNEIRQYDRFEQLYIVPSKEATSFCPNTSFRNAHHTANIRDGFLWVPTLRENGGHGKGRVYICYLGAMEDDDGNLLVLDHPKINQYYEWALKERVLQNQYLNGEPDILQRWQLASKELKTARIEALSITTMPDFAELKNVIESNRRAMYHKYLHPFSSLYANAPGWPWSINSEYI